MGTMSFCELLKGMTSCSLATADVGRQHLGRQEALSGERTLARTAGTDEDDER